jgi:hypothetical protein
MFSPNAAARTSEIATQRAELEDELREADA